MREFEVVGTGTASVSVIFKDLAIAGESADDGGVLGGKTAMGGGFLIDGGQVTLSNVTRGEAPLPRESLAPTERPERPGRRPGEGAGGNVGGAASTWRRPAHCDQLDDIRLRALARGRRRHGRAGGYRRLWSIRTCWCQRASRRGGRSRRRWGLGGRRRHLSGGRDSETDQRPILRQRGAAGAAASEGMGAMAGTAATAVSAAGESTRRRRAERVASAVMASKVGTGARAAPAGRAGPAGTPPVADCSSPAVP